MLNGLAQPIPLGGDERLPEPVVPGEVGASARQPSPFAVADGVVLSVLVPDGVLGGVLVADAVLDKVLVADGELDSVLVAGGAVVVRTGLGGTPEPFRVMSELPLLWYPSVARIM